MTIDQLARAFITRQRGTCHNAASDGQAYRLHGHTIAEHVGEGIRLDWCGYYTVTTANHLNAILEALDPTINRISRAKDRDAGIERRVYSLTGEQISPASRAT